MLVAGPTLVQAATRRAADFEHEELHGNSGGGAKPIGPNSNSGLVPATPTQSNQRDCGRAHPRMRRQRATCYGHRVTGASLYLLRGSMTLLAGDRGSCQK